MPSRIKQHPKLTAADLESDSVLEAERAEAQTANGTQGEAAE